MKTKHLGLWVLALGLGIFGPGIARAASTVDGSITVTPVATVSLTLAPTSYAFGPVAVAISTVSISSLTLTNNGQVSVTVSKQILTDSTPAGWTAGAAAGADTYALYVSTSATRPGAGSFSANTRFSAGGASNNLTGLAGSQPTIAVAGSADLWFRLDMPLTVTNQTARTITVRFTGTGL